MNGDVEKALALMERTIEILRLDSDDGWISIIERAAADVRGGNWFTRKEALYRLGNYCSARGLEDVMSSAIELAEWYEHLQVLRDHCARAFNQIERSPGSGP